MSPLLENAVVSIQLGLEDYASDDERRVVSAVRNLYSGVLLLAKEVLRELSPPESNDILIRSSTKAIKTNDGAVNIIGDGKKTIDRSDIVKRFKQLGLNVDLSNLARLAEIRNDIEHFHSSARSHLIQEVIADAMPMIRGLIVNEIGEEPSILLGLESWDTLLSIAQVFTQERDACQSSFNEIDWGNDTLRKAFEDFHCSNCSSPLIRNDNAAARKPVDLSLVCSKCGQSIEISDVIEAALERQLSVSEYLLAKDGGEPELEECPECFKTTFVRFEDQCLNPECGFILGDYKCAICREPLTLGRKLINGIPSGGAF